MVVIEIPPNPNCEPVDLRVFHEVDASHPVYQLCLECARTDSDSQRAGETGRPAWYEVTGWTASGSPCPARVQRVDDSGDGVAILVYGGNAGLRLRPAGSAGSWRLDDPQQWGVSYLILADANDIR